MTGCACWVALNGLSGVPPLPWRQERREQMLSLSLEGNAFEYDEESADFNALVATCRGATVCSGVPPSSCQAFGKRFELKLSDPNECIECEDLLKIAVLFAGLLACFLIALSVYIRLMVRDPAGVKKWVSSTIILVNHGQTLSLIGLLKLGWPKSVEVVTDTLAIDLLNFGGSKPECFFQALSDEATARFEANGGTLVSHSCLSLVAFAI